MTTGSLWPIRLTVRLPLTLLPRAFRTARPECPALQSPDLTESAAGATPWAMVSAALSPLLLVAGWLIADAVQRPSYSPLHQTVSVLAGYGGTDRWIMTGALFAVGCCHLITVLGLRGLRRSARVALLIAGIAAFGVAACPEPVHGSTPQHVAFTVLGAVVIAIWPALTATRRKPRAAVLSVHGALAITVVFLGLLAWLALETRGGSALGLAERVGSASQTTWPFIVALALRRCAEPEAL